VKDHEARGERLAQTLGLDRTKLPQLLEEGMQTHSESLVIGCLLIPWLITWRGTYRHNSKSITILLREKDGALLNR
jgi:hypothetical protein